MENQDSIKVLGQKKIALTELTKNQLVERMIPEKKYPCLGLINPKLPGFVFYNQRNGEYYFGLDDSSFKESDLKIIYEYQFELTDIENQEFEPIKTREEVEELKKQWVKCKGDEWDLENTPGYEEWHDELLVFSDLHKAQWNKDFEEREQKRKEKAVDLLLQNFSDDPAVMSVKRGKELSASANDQHLALQLLLQYRQTVALETIASYIREIKLA